MSGDQHRHRYPCRVNLCDRARQSGGLCRGHTRLGEDAILESPGAPLVRDAEGRKRCTMCEQWLAIVEFKRDSRNKDGLHGNCLTCGISRRRARLFNVPEDWFDLTFAAQGGRCAICQSSSPRGRGWAIDHDHTCCPIGARSCGSCVRGILCGPCNTGLGMFVDSPKALSSAIDYLQTHGAMIGRQ